MKKRKIIGIIFIILGLLLITILEKNYVQRPFSIDRFIVYVLTILFIASNIIFDRKKIWNSIYAYRYIIGVFIFIYIIIMGYNGSSLSAYDEVIEPSYKVENSTPIIGDFRSIRSDEFLVDTPAILSQYNHNDDFDYINDALMARNTTVYMFPQLPTKTISILTNPRLIGFLFLPINQAYSFYWYLPYFALFFGLFEMFMILTNKNKKISLLGTVMLVFSPSIQWWNSPAFLLYGSLATVFFYNIFFVKSRVKKIVYSILLGWMGSCYIMILYPAWQVVYGYLFLGLFIWCLISNKKNIRKTDFLYLMITVLIIGILILPPFLNSANTINAITSTVYPGARSSIGGYGWQLYYNYFSTIYFSIFDVANPCESSQFLSLYPLPIMIGFIACVYNFIKKKNDVLLIILTSLALLLTIWNYIPIGIVTKISLLSISTPDRAQLIVGVICIFIIVNLMAKYETDHTTNLKKVMAIVLSIATTTFGIYIANKQIPDYMSHIMIVISFVVFASLIYFFVINEKKTNMLFLLFMILFGIFQFLTIHPINKNISIMTDKPLANEIKKISSVDKNGVWAVINAPIHLQSYILANGARVINSTNYYPNLKLWKKFDPYNQNNEVYNRYAHIVIDITSEETKFELIQADLFRFYINKSDICKLDIDYIATTVQLEDYEINNINKIYQVENILLYEINCN